MGRADAVGGKGRLIFLSPVWENKGKEDVVVECIMKPYVRIDERGELFFGRSFVKT
jgi:hypothetical protein